MPITVTPVSAQTTPLRSLATGDLVSQANILDVIQRLCNHIQWLEDNAATHVHAAGVPVESAPGVYDQPYMPTGSGRAVASFLLYRNGQLMLTTAYDVGVDPYQITGVAALDPDEVLYAVAVLV
jgi:hypothetical protein